jgi:1-acyl-sn-glycerol-3-phosphate acyltransferase
MINKIVTFATMKIIRVLHISHAILVFIILFFLLMPFFLIPIVFKTQHHLIGFLNRVWAKLFFAALLFPYKNEYRFKPKKGAQYIFCPNHFSYLDIPSMALNKVNAIFVGKNDMSKVPLFGFMYSKLHITVDRNSFKSRYSTISKSIKAIDEGKSLMIFPEGGMLTTKAPLMAPFKDGAFRIAIEKQIPIVPVTIPFNWIILPDGSFSPLRRTMKTIYHEPIETIGLTLSDVKDLKTKTFDIINAELKIQLNENR